MPGGDGRGPQGMGAMTGRGLGFCAEYVGEARPGFVSPGFIPGRGFYGRGARGRGFGNRFYAAGPAVGMQTDPVLTVEEETSMLKQDADMLSKQLQDIQNRIAILENEKKS